MSEVLWVKICGVTEVSDAQMIAELGADAIGLNFIARSKRRITVERARQIVDGVRGRLECIGVVADLDEATIRELLEQVGLDRVQLHGHESPELVERLGERAYKALGIMSKKDVDTARGFPGDPLLVDASVEGWAGGTGRVFDWKLLGDLVSARRIVLAGGLHPDNVAAAVRAVAPYGIDVASGVEERQRPHIKDPRLVESFITRARNESQRLHLG